MMKKQRSKLPTASKQHSRISKKYLTKFQIHPIAKQPYQIFCEYIQSTKNFSNASRHRTLYFDVFFDGDTYYFYNNFLDVAKINENDSEVYVRKVQPDDKVVEFESWQTLWQLFLQLNPVDTLLYKQLKSHIPLVVQHQLLGDKLSIEKVLTIKGIKRHQYDYQYQLQKKEHFVMPSFAELISEVINEN